MKISKILAAAAAAALSVSMLTVGTGATNWANATYGDNNPDTGTMVSTDENSATIKAAVDGGQIKLSVHVKDLLEAENYDKVKSLSWDLTYDFSNATSAGSWIGGGTYVAFKNSDGGYEGALNANIEWGEDGNPSGYIEDKVTVSDSAKFILPTEVFNDDSELCFIDWSQADCNWATNGLQITVSNLKFFDADGNEVPQKAYEGTAAATPAVETEATPAETAETAPVADTAPTTAATTGNTAMASIAAVMVVAGAAAVAAKKRK